MDAASRISFFVPGLPATQGSKVHLGKGRIVDSCKRLKPWRAAVAAAAIDAHSGPILTGPVRLAVDFHLPRPKWHHGTGRNAGTIKPSAPPLPIVKPDLSKMLRAVEDAMRGIIWRDDSQVVICESAKLYADEPLQPGALVSIHAIPDGDTMGHDEPNPG